MARTIAHLGHYFCSYFGARHDKLLTFILPILGYANYEGFDSEGEFMKNRLNILILFLLTALTPCFAHHTAVVVNKDNSIENVTSAHLAKIVRGEVKKWPDGKGIIFVLHKESEGESETLERLNKMSAPEWKAFVAAHKDSFVFVDTDADVLKIVQAEPGAIGLIETHSIDSTVNVVHVDGKLPMEFGYLPH
jgi:hypothetical protein